jgi:hypothetical protein
LNATVIHLHGIPASRLWKQVSKKPLTSAPAIWLCGAVAFAAAVYAGAYTTLSSEISALAILV